MHVRGTIVAMPFCAGYTGLGALVKSATVLALTNAEPIKSRRPIGFERYVRVPAFDGWWSGPAGKHVERPAPRRRSRCGAYRGPVVRRASNAASSCRSLLSSSLEAAFQSSVALPPTPRAFSQSTPSPSCDMRDEGLRDNLTRTRLPRHGCPCSVGRKQETRSRCFRQTPSNPSARILDDRNT